MKKIQTLEQSEKTRKRNTLILSIFMLLILVFGTIGYGLLSNSRTNSSNSKSNGKITEVGGELYTATISNQQFYFKTSPDSAENISVMFTKTLGDYGNFPLYISSNNDAVTYEIASTLGRFAPRTQNACHEECEENFPIKNCSQDNIIIWQDSTENQVYQKENCIFINGDLTAVDAFLYKILGLI